MTNPPHASTLKAHDGTSLHVIDIPVDAAKGGVMLMHGLGEHSGRYPHVMRFFNSLGLSVRAYDHRGHGRSGGARGDVPDDETILQDAKLVFDDFAQKFSTPPILLGHSMGGLFAARFATGRLSPISALILSSPALAIPLSGVQKGLLKILGTVAPGLGISNGLKTAFLSHAPAVEQAYLQDPHVHGKITSRLLHSMLAAKDFAQAQAHTLRIPTLLIVAGDDRLVDASGSREFSGKLAGGIGTMHLYNGFYHEIFNEVEQQRVFDDVRAWLNRPL
jgi:alpha-beta hydrolase superfamily lysophospholipase